MGEKASAILNLRSIFSKGRGRQAPLDQTMGELHLKGKYFKRSKILRRTEDLLQLKISTDPRKRVQTSITLTVWEFEVCSQPSERGDINTTLHKKSRS